MKLPPLSRERVRQIDRIAIEQYGIPGVILMENAGRGAAELIHKIAPTGRIAILCGKGNNAGDGYVIARHLDLMDREVTLVSIVDVEELTGDAAINAQIARKSELDLQIAITPDSIRLAMAEAEIIVDCLLGTGARGELIEPFRSAVEAANALSAIRIAIDVPTGLDCDTGQPNDPTFEADHTISFVAEKTGLKQQDANDYVGNIHVVRIGVPRKLLREFL